MCSKVSNGYGGIVGGDLWILERDAVYWPSWYCGGEVVYAAPDKM